jgi:hypothetical protein
MLVGMILEVKMLKANGLVTSHFRQVCMVNGVIGTGALVWAIILVYG